VQAGLCTHPSDWPWSSYGALVGDHDPEAVIASPAVLELFGPDQASAMRRLRAFVDSTSHAEARSLTLRV
jgi:hypothetical protein